MTTLWTMPVEEIEQKREFLKRELDVHRENDITNIAGWETIEETYMNLIHRYDDELRKRETDAI